MLGKWVRFDNKIPVDGIWWAQESPHSEDIGVQDERYSQPPESRKSGIPRLRTIPRSAHR